MYVLIKTNNPEFMKEKLNLINIYLVKVYHLKISA